MEWIESWRNQADLFLSLWILLFVLSLAALWTAGAVLRAVRREAPAAPQDAAAPLPRPRVLGAWAALLFVICLAELLSHSGTRNGFLASSRPESGVEAWTAADGYATLLDGVPAQGDGLFLLPMLRTFLDEGAPGPSEYDRRAGHTYLVALLQRPLGTYWGFAALNLLAWWGAALGVWWLGRRYWPGTLVPWIASLFVATGGGFVFMGAAPQPHAVAFGAFVLLLVLAESLAVWESRPAPAAGIKLGWATGAAGLIYFVHFPALLYYWLYGLAGGRARPRLLLTATAVAVALLFVWQGYAAVLLGLTFAGGNNEYAGEAVRSWLTLAARGPEALLGQLHGGSLRGLFAGAFPYLYWVLALLGLLRSPARSRVWALAILVAATLPAIAFTTRFQLPRLAYFAYPAVYLLAAAGVAALASWLGGRSRPRRLLIAAGAVLVVAALANADLAGSQRFNVWFHYGMGNTW
ncbi:MAG TPA: hypothetical protein VNK05_07545 [Chloroflexota bacterium]|nr:hypothetical protein [Chloroflexota bacterium]